MAGTNDWNAKTIADFRANQGRVGGPFEGAPITLVHHRGRHSGREYASPVMHLADDDHAATIYVFGSKATVSELEGEKRGRVFDEQVRRYPGFAGYAEKTTVIRTIPVLALRRAKPLGPA